MTSQNVVIRNVKMTVSSVAAWAIRVAEGGSATIDHVDVAGLDQSTKSVEYAILSQTNSPVTVSHSNLHNCADCIQGERVTIVANYIHDLANPPGAHVDGIQCNASCGITVTGNTILNQWPQTSTVALFADFGTPMNSTISGNLLAGGGYSIYGGGDNARGISITNNRFSKLYYPQSGSFGESAYMVAPNVWSGNYWDENGATVTN